MAWPNIYGLDSSRFDQNARPQRLPSIILVHDAFHTQGHFDLIVNKISQAGFGAIQPSLPSAIYQFTGLEDDIQAVMDAGKKEINAEKDVVIVMHGYSGIVGSAAAHRLNQYSTDRPRAGHVVKLIFIAGVVVAENESLLDAIQPRWINLENSIVTVRRPAQVFYQDCTAEISRDAVSKLHPQAESTFRDKATSPGWSYIPSLYIVCELDNAYPADFQRRCAKRLQTSNRHTSVSVLQAGHVPFLSRARETANLIIGASTTS